MHRSVAIVEAHPSKGYVPTFSKSENAVMRGTRQEVSKRAIGLGGPCGETVKERAWRHNLHLTKLFLVASKLDLERVTVRDRVHQNTPVLN